MRQRIEWLDNLRAISIFFVVLGHTVGLTDTMEKLIFSFHMPVFFWISGVLVRDSVREERFAGFIRKRWKSRLIPYATISIVSYAAWLLLFRHFGSQAEAGISPLRPLVGMLYGNGINDWLVHNTVLWYFLCLVVTEVIFFWVVKARNRALFVSILFALSVVGYLDTWINPPDGFRLPWNADIALTTVVFYGLGYLMRGYVLDDTRLKRFRLPVALAALIAWACFSLLNAKVAIVAGVYGNYAWFYLAAIAGILFWTHLSRVIPPTRLASLVGRHTLVIFSLHLLLFPLFTAVLVYVFRLPSSVKDGSLPIALCYTVGSILILLPVAELIMRKFPWFLGQRPQRSQPVKNEAQQAPLAPATIAAGGGKQR